MFTGIVEKVGIVQGLQSEDPKAFIRMTVGTGFSDLAIGESVAVDGVCLTITALKKIDDGQSASFDLSAETLEKTRFKNLERESRVNLERSLQPTGRLSGHWVLGHADGIGAIDSIRRENECTRLKIQVPKALLRYAVSKGSMCIDGISLTINQVDDAAGTVEFMIIPHTWEHTTLQDRKIGDSVNLEADYLAKLVERLCQTTIRT